MTEARDLLPENFDCGAWASLLEEELVFASQFLLYRVQYSEPRALRRLNVKNREGHIVTQKFVYVSDWLTYEDYAAAH